MKLIVGLGNIGKNYDNTRHNVGFMFLDYISKKLNVKIEKKQLDSLTGEILINNDKIILAKPVTYMNLSGNAVSKLKKYYKIEDNDILVIFDDIDIKFNDIRYRITGSAGTHNGMKNIVEMINSKDIARIKIGIGGIKHENQDLTAFVLQKFSKQESILLEDIFDKVYEKMLDFIDND